MAQDAIPEGSKDMFKNLNNLQKYTNDAVSKELIKLLSKGNKD